MANISREIGTDSGNGNKRCINFEPPCVLKPICLMSFPVIGIPPPRRWSQHGVYKFQKSRRTCRTAVSRTEQRDDVRWRQSPVVKYANQPARSEVLRHIPLGSPNPPCSRPRPGV